MPYNPVAFKERDLRRAVRAAMRENLEVAAVEVTKDGVIRVLTAPSDPSPAPSEEVAL